MKRIKAIILTSVFFLVSLMLLSIAFLTVSINSNAASIPSGQKLDTIVDTISVSDLTFNGLTNQSMIGENVNTDATFSFSGGNTNKNLAFKFKYDFVDNTSGDDYAFRVHFDVADNKWDTKNAIWIKGDSVRLARVSGDWGFCTLAALTLGVHEIEYGRIALLYSSNNEPTGKYYCYYKLDGIEIRSDINTYDVSKMDNTMFLNFGQYNKSNKVYDANLTYETPQYVSISDLKNAGNYVGSSIADSDISYTYDTSDQPANHSTVFVANVDYLVAENSQIYLYSDSDKNWNYAGFVWFQPDRTYFGTNDADGVFTAYKEIKYTALEDGSQHSIEYGRLAVMNGATFTGRYHVYFKLDGIVIYGIDQKIMDGVKEGGRVHITGSSHFNYLDAYTLETAKEISVSDLKNGGTPVGNSLFIDAQKNLTFNNEDHKANNSLVFKCKYESFEAKNNQIHLSCTGRDEAADKDYKWHNASSVILNNDTGTKVHLGKSTKTLGSNSWYDINYTMTPGTIYDVEFGRKAVMYNGVFTGKYYVYLKIDDELVGWGYHGIPQPIVEGDLVFITADGQNMIHDKDYAPIDLSTDLYLYKWDVSKSGIKFTGRILKDQLDTSNLDEIGFVVAPSDELNNSTKIIGKAVSGDTYYVVNAALSALDIENITREYSAKLYYIINGNTFYSSYISTSFYEELYDLSGLSEGDRSILNNIKSNVLEVTLNEDTCAVSGATKSGDFSSSSIVLTGANNSYVSFVLNGKLLENGEITKIGYINYLVTLGTNKITLTKQAKSMMYGGSEHFVELNSGHDEKMTAAYLAPMTSNIGLTTVRLDIDFSDLFTISSTNTLTVKSDYVNRVRGVINELKTNGGVTDFLAVFWVIQPYGFKNWAGKPWTGKTAPNPSTQTADYLTWLQINGEAARIAASLFPDIHNFETWNEPEIMCEADGPLAKPDGTNYSVSEKAKILTDLMYYYNRGIKEANPENRLTTPSICCSQQTDTEFDVTSPNFLTALYQAITDATPVTGYAQTDTNPNNYFQVINIHPYLARGTSQTNWKDFVSSFHTVSQNYGDGGTEIWITEFGFATNRESYYTSKMTTILTRASELEYVTRLYFYKVHDYTDKIDTDRWGLYDYDGNIKSIGTTVKNYINS